MKNFPPRKPKIKMSRIRCGNENNFFSPFSIFSTDGRSQDVKLFTECNSTWKSGGKVYEKQNFIIQIKLAQRKVEQDWPKRRTFAVDFFFFFSF